MRFLYTTDWHLRGTNPRSRKDNFQLAMQDKIEEVFTLAKSKGCSAILHGGDLFDSPDPSYGVLSWAAELLKQSPLPIYVVPGNHDIFAYNITTLPRTALGLLGRLGIVNILMDETVRLYQYHNEVVTVGGIPCTMEMDKSPMSYVHGTGTEDIDILVAHGMLMPERFPFGRCTTIAEVAEVVNAKIILTGDYHLGYEVVKMNGKIFCNPGALGRISAAIPELSRWPGVAIVDTSNNNVDIIHLKRAKPGEEVLDREHLEQEAEKEQSMKKFVDLLKGTGERKYLNIYEIMEGIAGEDRLPTDVVDLAKEKITMAREMGAGN